jgi:hypothetical protein
MLVPVYCRGCGKRLEIPAGFTKAKRRCAECGIYTDLPPDLRQKLAENRPAKDSDSSPTPLPPKNSAFHEPRSEEVFAFLSDPLPPLAPDSLPDLIVDLPDKLSRPAPPPPLAVPEREILVQGTDEDDLKPYTVHGDAPKRKCPECDRHSDARVNVCVHCGHNFVTGEKSKRTYDPVERHWESGWPLQIRLQVFAGMQVVNLCLLALSMASGYMLCALLVPALMIVALQAFLIGTFEKLSLSRDLKGRVRLMRAWRGAFIPQTPTNVQWREHESIIVIRTNTFSIMDWFFAIVLLGYGIVPGVLFWYFVIQRDKFAVFLCKDHGSPETPIFRTINEDVAKELMKAVSEATALPMQ